MIFAIFINDFQERLAAHWANLNSVKWMLWNDGVDMAEFGMTRVRNGEPISTPLVEVYCQSIDQLAHVQEETNGMEPSRSAVLASRKTAIINGRLDRYTRHHSAPADMAA